MDARTWIVLAIGAGIGACICLISGAVRDVLLDAVDAVVCWWWDVVDATRRVLAWTALLTLVFLAGWAVIALLLPRLV